MNIDKLVDRFLAWPVPTSVCPDNLDADGRMRPGGSGTNLLTATEAKQMLEHVLKYSSEIHEIQSLVSGLKKLLKPHEYEYIYKMIVDRALSHPDGIEILVGLDSKGESK